MARFENGPENSPDVGKDIRAWSGIEEYPAVLADNAMDHLGAGVKILG